MTDATPLPDDDEAAAELLADAWVARAATDPQIRRIALRAAGLTKEPAHMTLEELAQAHGTDRHTLSRVAAKALQKLRFSPEVRSLKSQS